MHGKMGNAYMNLIGKSVEKNHLGVVDIYGRNNFKMYVKEI